MYLGYHAAGPREVRKGDWCEYVHGKRSLRQRTFERAWLNPRQVLASSPHYPQGTMDPIEEIAAIAVRHGKLVLPFWPVTKAFFRSLDRIEIEISLRSPNACRRLPRRLPHCLHGRPWIQIATFRLQEWTQMLYVPLQMKGICKIIFQG